MKTLLLLMLMIVFCLPANAATIHFKNGSSISGTIVERSDDSVKLEVSGVSLTYYSDEIDRIEEDANPPESQGVGEAAIQNDPVAQEPPPVAPAAPEPQSYEAAEPMSALSAGEDYAGLSKKELILKFIDVFGTRKSMQLNFEEIQKTLPPAQANDFKRAFQIDDIIEQLVPLYDKRFTEADLKVYIEFYSTPQGQKLVNAIPEIMNESIEVSAKYFDERMPDSLKETNAAPASSGRTE